MNSTLLLLASGSPRRREILQQIGVAFRIGAISVDETVIDGETAHDYLPRIVDLKLAAARALLSGMPVGRVDVDGPAVCAAVVVADTTVVLGEQILGKPTDPAHARMMVTALAGHPHEVRTRFALATRAGQVLARTVTSHVEVGPMSGAQVDAYVATGEGVDKAGGYAVQGVFARFIRRIEGSYTGIMGLPAAEVAQALRELGLSDDSF